MSFKCGIVGLPNVGKSTLFNALTNSSKAQAANFPFCTIDPNVGVVPVPDIRLNNLAKISKSKKIIGLSLKSYVESEYDNLHEVHSIRDHAFGHGLSANFELKAGLLHGHAISVEMTLSSFMSYRRGWLSEKDLHRILKLFSEYELSLWHDILLCHAINLIRIH